MVEYPQKGGEDMRRMTTVRTVVLSLVLVLFACVSFGTLIPPIEILTTTEAYDPIRYEAGFMIAEEWEKMGFTVSVRPLEFSTLLARVGDEQDFDVHILGWSGRVERLDPQHFLQTLYGEQIELGGMNRGGYVNPIYDALFVAQSREFDSEVRRQLVLELQEVYTRDNPLDVLFYRDEVNAFNNTTFTNYVVMAGEALYNEWTPLNIVPLTDKKVLTIGTPQEPDSINPLVSTSVWGWKFMRMTYDKLVRLSPDIEPIPWAAEEIISVDEVTLDIILRSGMTFHDGMPVTVEDVKFTFDYYIEHDFAYFRSFFYMIEEVEILADNHVRFKLEEPYAPFVTVTLTQIPILPKHIWEDIESPTDLTPAQIPTVGSGPFKFDRYDRGEYKRILTFEDHFAADDINIDAVEYIIYADSEGVFTGLITGEIDMTAWRLEPGQIPLAEREDHVTVVNVPDFGYYYLTYNLRREPFGNTELRQALSHLIDKNTIIDVLLEGRGEVGTSVIAPINAYWHNPDVVRYGYNPEIARKILEEAGYRWDAQGRIMYPEGY